jgi:diguanylate cyclase (GGDEF)-like protein
VSPSAVPPPPPARAPIGSTATVRSRLSKQPPRPLLVRLYAGLFADGGLAGAPARRRFRRALLRALPALLCLAGAAAVVTGTFEASPLGLPGLVGLSVLALGLVGLAWRHARRRARGEKTRAREQLEGGALFLVAAAALVQVTGEGAAEPPLQPVIYLLMAFMVSRMSRRLGFTLVLLAVGLELGRWAWDGADPLRLVSPATHSAFIALFAVLYYVAMASQMRMARDYGEDVARERRREIDEKAADFRLLAPRGGEGGAEADPGSRWFEGAVLEVEKAVHGVVEVAALALRSQTCAIYLLDVDDKRLVRRECRSDSDAIAAEVPAGEGVLGAVVRRQAPVRVHGEVKAPSYHTDGRRPGARLAVPVIDRRGGHLRGVLLADRDAPDPFTDEDERMLVAQAAAVMRAIVGERLMGEIKQARDEYRRFLDGIEQLNKATTLDQVSEISLEVARGMVAGAAFAAVTLVEPVEGRSTHRVARTWTASGKELPLEGLTFGETRGSLVCSVVALESSLPAAGIDVEEAVIFDADTRLRGLASLKVVPLKAQPLKTGDATVLGTLVLGSRHPDAFNSDLVRQLDAVAKQAAESIKRARLFDATERLATTDGLTGLLNHRTFQGRLDEQLLSAQRYGRKLSLIICDIDHFKSVNDTYGHPVGDQVLKGVAAVLSREARTTDVVARYGGEEFAVVMPETDGAGALVIAERIRERIGAMVSSTPQGPLKVTMSLGIATFPDDGQKKAELVERADGCLYHAKRHGRNRAVSSAQLKGPRRPGA